MTLQRYSNRLIHETSPYLLQHAHNPVQWQPWDEEAWDQAKNEDKLVLISIGYSSCHWCHVMERESFESEPVARLMNEHFVCIKVDREERPDIDQVYMTAVQLMTGAGGWPLNCFCLPDGRPVYGGTYFPKETWMDLLSKLHVFYKENKAQAKQYAGELTKGIQQAELVTANTSTPGFAAEDAKEIVDQWRKYFDRVEGGPNRAPKFPLPNNFEFLLHYFYVTRDESILEYIQLTLNKMAYGGIYDQLGGGFSRYSTDAYWKAPHFEKMLYDNAQLISLYSHAWQLTKNELYKNVVNETMEFVRRELTSDEGGFYSALDADSEGEEGKYYVWKDLSAAITQRKEALPGGISPEQGLKILNDYFSINKDGYWENGNYILLRKESEKTIAVRNHISVGDLNILISESKSILLKERNKRTRPGLDDKLLTSWNALMIKACCDAYDAFGEKKYLDAALNAVRLFLARAKTGDRGLLHQIWKSHSSKGNNGGVSREKSAGFLEDYSFMLEALISLFQSTFDEQWLNEARDLAEDALLHFYDEENGMFYFTSDRDAPLIARKKEIADNVIPSSNSSMAKALYYLGTYFENKKYLDTSLRMLNNVKDAMPSYGSGYSNWGILLLHYTYPFHEIVIAGSEAGQKRKELNQYYLPNKILAGSIDGNSNLSLLEQRFVAGKTLIYICEDRTCKLPVESISEALEQVGS